MSEMMRVVHRYMRKVVDIDIALLVKWDLSRLVWLTGLEPARSVSPRYSQYRVFTNSTTASR